MPFDFRAGLYHPWEATDGFGNWSSGTAAGPNTRRDHALLSHRDELGNNWILVNHAEEWVEWNGREVPLTSTIYFDHNAAGSVSIYPQGYRHLIEFQSHPFPRWTWKLDEMTLVRTIRTVSGQPGFLVEFVLMADDPDMTLMLVALPMLSGRRATDLHLENRVIDARPKFSEKAVGFRPYATAPEVVISYPDSVRFEADSVWYRRIRLITDPADEEALLSPGRFTLALTPARPAWIHYTTTPESAATTAEASSVIAPEFKPPPASVTAFRRHLRTDQARNALSFLSGGAAGKAEIEIVVPTLFLLDEIISPALLKDLVESHREDLVEAALDRRLQWVILVAAAARRGVELKEAARGALELMDRILENACEDSHPDSRMLLNVLTPGASWWERTDERCAARLGLPVDIQALWVNALASAEILNRILQSSSRNFGPLFLKASQSVRDLFWDSECGYLFDLADNKGDGAGSLHHSARLSSAPLLLPALRFEVFSPSRNRMILETAMRRLGGVDKETGMPGIRAFEDNKAVHPWLIALSWKAWRSSGGVRPVSLLGNLAENPPAANPVALAGLIAACVLEKEAAPAVP